MKTSGRSSLRGPVFLMALITLVMAPACGFNIKENSFESTPDTTVIGHTENRLTTTYNIMARCETGVGDMAADAMVWRGIDAQIGLINVGSIRRRDKVGETWIEPGHITREDIILLLPFDNLKAATPATIVMVSLTGSVLKEALENSFSRMTSDGGEGTSFGRFLQVSGITVFADVRKPVGSRVTKMTFTATGETIDPSDKTRTYRTAIPLKYVKNAAGFQDFDGYWEIFAKGADVVDTKVYLFNAMTDFISTFSPLTGYVDSEDCFSVPGIPASRLLITTN